MNAKIIQEMWTVELRGGVKEIELLRGAKVMAKDVFEKYDRKTKKEEMKCLLLSLNPSNFRKIAPFLHRILSSETRIIFWPEN